MSRSRSPHSWSLSWRTPPADALGWTIEFLLIALLAFAPFAFGAVEPWAEFVVVCLAAMLAGCVAMRLVLRSDKSAVRTWAFVPLLLFIALASTQLLPLPAKLIGLLSPGTVATRQRFLGDLPDAADRLQAFPLSLYPHATRHDLRLVLVGAAIFFSVINYYRHACQMKRLLGSIVIIGAAASLLALAQDLSGSEKIYFIGPHGRGRASAGPFVHYSHYSQFMNLCVGAALSLMLLVLYTKFRRKGFELAELSHRWRELSLRPVWFLGGFVILGVTTVFLSGSRGGMIATLFGFGILTLALSQIEALPGRGWLVLPLMLMVFGVGSFVGLDASVNRLSTLTQADQTGGRWQMLKDITRVWRAYPVVGTGLGTHEVVYPRYDSSSNLARATHAENEYAQVTEETGFVGLGLVLWFAGILWINFARVIRTGDAPSRLAISGLGFGLFAVTVHSLTDFGQHIPAVICFTAVTCGLIICVARRASDAPAVKAKSVSEQSAKTERPLPVSPVTPIPSSLFARVQIGVLTLLIIGASLWAVTGAGERFSAATEWRLAESRQELLAGNQWLGSAEEYSDLFTHVTAAVNRDPEDVEHRCLLDTCRWQLVEVRRLSDSSTASMEQVRNEALSILSDLQRARWDCPVYGPAYSLSAEIERGWLNSPLAEWHALAAFELSQTNANACLLAATADVHARRFAESTIKIQHYLSIAGSFDAVIDLYVHQAGRPDLAINLAGNNIDSLYHLATALKNDPRFTDLGQQVDQQAFELLRQRCSRSDAPADLLVQFAGESLRYHDRPTAISSYRRAIELNYGQVDWHLALAQILADANQIPEAKHEAEICLRLRPEMPAARKMVGDLSLLPGGRDD